MTHGSRFIAASLVVGALAAASIAAAQGSRPAAPSDGQPPADHHGMMKHHDGMMGGGMMGMTGMDPAQMSRMVENCNRMMGAMLQQGPASPDAPTAPDGKPKP